MLALPPTLARRPTTRQRCAALHALRKITGSGTARLATTSRLCGCCSVADGLSPRTIYPEYANSSVLHAAASKGAFYVVRLLLEAGAAANCCDTCGNAPLANAICTGQLACARELIPRTDLRILNASGKNVLHASIICNQLEIFKLLLPHFADNIDVRTIKGRPPGNTGQPGVTDGPYNITPLHLACQGGYHAMVIFRPSGCGGLAHRTQHRFGLLPPYRRPGGAPGMCDAAHRAP